MRLVSDQKIKSQCYTSKYLYKSATDTHCSSWEWQHNLKFMSKLYYFWYIMLPFIWDSKTAYVLSLFTIVVFNGNLGGYYFLIYWVLIDN